MYRQMTNATDRLLPATFPTEAKTLSFLSLIFTEASFSIECYTDEVHVYNSAIQDADTDDDKDYDELGALVVSYQVE